VGVPLYRFSEVARLLAVSDDTVRRWVEAGRLAATRDDVGRNVVEGAELAKFAKARADQLDDPTGVARSARNQFVGLVTDVRMDRIMSQVELQCGPHRMVSLMSTEAVQELGLAPGTLAVAVVKSTNVVIEVPAAAR
jgi:molybdopterin-binding protein